MASVLENLRLEEGKSDALRNAFACLEEASNFDGSPRYPDRVMTDLKIAIVCRTYARPILEFCHFVTIIEKTGRGFIDFIWEIEHLNSSGFRQGFKRTGNTGSDLDIGGSGVKHLSGKYLFQIMFSRMTFLAAVTEFLITILGYRELLKHVRALSDVDVGPEDIDRIARDLQKAVYDYLRDHLPTAQKQRRERHFLSFVAAREPDARTVEVIDDDLVLAYWRTAAFDPAADAKTFRGVADMVYALLWALRSAAEQMHLREAKPIGSDPEAGEVDPADVAVVTASLADEPLSIDGMVMTAGAVKFLTKTEATLIADVPLDQAVQRQLRLTILRVMTQGRVQNSLVAARQRDKDMASIGGQGLTPPRYEDAAHSLIGIADTLENLCLAALWALHQSHRMSAIEMAMDLAPDLNWGNLIRDDGPDDSGVVSMSAHRAATHFFDEQPNAKGDEIASLLADARRSWQRTGRAGFQDPEDDDALDTIEDVAPTALKVARSLRHYIAQFGSDFDWAAVETSDGSIFSDMFARLYGADIKRMTRTRHG